MCPSYQERTGYGRTKHWPLHGAVVCSSAATTRNPKLTVQARKAGQQANARIATERAAQAAGAESLRDIATGLNERGIPTARGTGI
jgi:hypothetical protein